MRSAAARAAVAAAVISVAWSLAPARADAATPTVLELSTVPTLPGAELEVGGVRFVTDGDGNATITLPDTPEGLPPLNVIDDASNRTDRETRFSRWWGVAPDGKNRMRAIAVFDVYQRVTWSYVEEADGRTVAPPMVSELVVRSSHGNVHTFGQPEPVWLHAERVVSSDSGLIVKRIDYHVESVLVDAAEVVVRGQQSFTPAEQPHWQIELLFFDARFSAVDAALGSPLTGNIRIEYPSGRVVRYALDSRGEMTLWLPRGTYRALVEAPGMQVWTPVVLSRDQTIPIKVLTYVDMGLGAAILAGIAFGLLLLGRPHLVLRRRARPVAPVTGAVATAALPPAPVTSAVRLEAARDRPADATAAQPPATAAAALDEGAFQSIPGRRPVPRPRVAQAVAALSDNPSWCPTGCGPSSPGAQFCRYCGTRRMPPGSTPLDASPVTPRATTPAQIQLSGGGHG